MQRITNVTLAIGLGLLASGAHAQCELSSLHGAGTGINDQFGNAVALSGEWAIAGRHFHDGIGGNSGSASILARQPDGSWVESQQLFASDEDTLDRYGFKVDIDTSVSPVAAVTARYNADAGYGSGVAYVYEWDGALWNETAILRAHDEAANDLFGTAVRVARETVVVGSNRDEVGGLKTGSAYVFEKVAGDWVETAKLTASDADAESFMGTDVAIHESSDLIAIGCPGASDTIPQIGAVYLYERDAGGWVETGRLTASDPSGFSYFGGTLAMHGDLLVAGAQLADADGLTDNGRAYVFERVGGAWFETAILEPDQDQDFGYFGSSVSVADGTVLVGAWPHDGAAGAVYVFENDGLGWAQKARLTASDAGPNEHFGHSLDISGSEAIIGARRAKNELGQVMGAAYQLSNFRTIRTLGAGCIGSGGFTQRLSLTGCTAPGGSLMLSLRGGLGGSLVAIFVGLEQQALHLASGCTVNINPFFLLAGPFPLTGSAPGEGAFDIPLELPLDVVGLTLAFQSVTDDPGVVGLTMSNGVDFTVSDP